MRLLGYRVPYPNQSDAVFLLHELFVNLSYAFDARSPAPRIVDCGANIGLSVLFFKVWSPNASILAIEPDAGAFRYLQDFIALNALQHVELMNAAIARERGTANFYSAPDADAGVQASLHADLGGASAARVTTIPLSDVIQGPVDFLKLDIEGAEYDAIDDLEVHDRLKWIRELVVECHDRHRDSAPRLRLVEQLERAGLHVSAVHQEGHIAVLHAARVSDST
jgi:FkbM family methyltransferase